MNTQELPPGVATVSRDYVCDLLQISESTLDRWRKSGMFPAEIDLPGRTVRWRLQDVLDFAGVSRYSPLRQTRVESASNYR